MGVPYQKLSESRRGGRAWVLLRRAAAGVVRLYAARRRWAVRCCARRLTWAALSGRVATAGRQQLAAGYDSASYARNFDDGVWNAGSFACRFARASSSE